MKTNQKIVILLLAFALILGMIPANQVSAAKKVSLSSKKVTVTKGKSKTLKVQNTKKKVKWKILSGKKYITLKKKGKVAVSIKGKKKGTAKVQATIGKKKLTCKVTVKNDTKATSNPARTPEPTNPTTPSATNTPLSANPTNAPEGANTDDVKALEELIRIHRGRGADVSEDMSNDEEYQWYDDRLIGICWRDKNVIGELDVTKCSALLYLECFYEGITINGYMPSRLTNLNVSKNTNLEVLRCYGTNLKSIDISNNVNLTELDCTGNYLSRLDISKNTLLEELDCSYNELVNLDLSNNTSLTFLNCDNNLLTQLDLSNNTKLSAINCRNNKLTNLDCSGILCGLSLHIACTDNQLISLILPAPYKSEDGITTNLSLLCENNCLTELDLTGFSLSIAAGIQVDDTVNLIGYKRSGENSGGIAK